MTVYTPYPRYAVYPVPYMTLSHRFRNRMTVYSLHTWQYTVYTLTVWQYIVYTPGLRAWWDYGAVGLPKGTATSMWGCSCFPRYSILL